MTATPVMDAALWGEVKEVLGGALERPAEEREAWLDACCAHRPAVRREVESLLDQVPGVAGFIETPAVAEHAALAEAATAPGSAIGPYRLERELGRGGMGVVYLAHRSDGAYRGTVAIKILPPWLAGDEGRRRFRHERQVLASLVHPNIARLLDGGTTEGGTPYLVMEHVDGEPIDAYCDVHALPVAARVALFRTICSAVQYAHQRLVIHRDLKPSNVLVGKDGVPKLLDFGIAKLLAPDAVTGSDFTRDVRPFTPEYASPEQIGGGAITTATDVHGLGALLYLLLTGRAPFAGGVPGPDALARRLRGERAPLASGAVAADGVSLAALADARAATPGKLVRELSGDLDNILARALAPDPADRYASVDELAADLARHQDGRPVRARAPNLAYRVRKFVGRNRWHVALGSAAVVAVGVALVMALWEASVADAQRARAERHFDSVRKLANALLFEFNDEIEKGPTRARALMVDKALAYLNTLAADADHDGPMAREVAAGYEKVAEVQGRPESANLGDAASAMANYRKSIAMRERLLAAEPGSRELEQALARSHDAVGDLLLYQGKAQAAFAEYERAMNLAQDLVRSAPNDPRARLYLAGRLGNRANALYQPGHPSLGDMAGALVLQRQALALREAVARDYPGDARMMLPLDASYQIMADMELIAGHPQVTATWGARCQSLLEPIVAAQPEDARVLRRLALCYRKSAHALAEQARFGEGLVFARKSLELRETLLRADPDNMRLRRDMALGVSGVANIEEQAGHYAEALAGYRRWADTTRELLARNPDDRVLRGNLMESESSAGDIQLKQGLRAAALDSYRRALDAVGASTGEPQDVDAGGLANVRAGLGVALARGGGWREGLPYLERAEAEHARLASSDPFNAWARRDLARTETRLGEVHARAAEDRTLDAASRARQRELACESRVRSAARWKAMRADGVMSPKDEPDARRAEFVAVPCQATDVARAGTPR